MADHEQQVVSANDLFDGDVVYLATDHGWTRVLHEAAVADDAANAATLLGIARGQSDRVVEPYLIGVRERDGIREPLHFRERLRHTGPSIFAAETHTTTTT